MQGNRSISYLVLYYHLITLITKLKLYFYLLEVRSLGHLGQKFRPVRIWGLFKRDTCTRVGRISLFSSYSSRYRIKSFRGMYWSRKCMVAQVRPYNASAPSHFQFCVLDPLLVLIYGPFLAPECP